MKSSALARRAAAYTSSSEAPGFPKRMFSMMVVPKSTGSCGHGWVLSASTGTHRTRGRSPPRPPPTWLMKPMTWPRSQEGSSEEMSWPSSVMLPCVGS